MNISRLFPDRFRLHPMGEETGHTSWSGRGFWRRIARILCAHHHRSRPDRRPPLRAVFSTPSACRCGFHIHFSAPGPSRRGDPLRQRSRPHQVAQIITFGTLQARGVPRDVGRVLQMPYGQVDKLCKLGPSANSGGAEFRSNRRSRANRGCRQSATVTRWSSGHSTSRRSLRASNRHASTHAAGIVIRRPAIVGIGAALPRDPKSDIPVTQFNMKWVEQAGLVKFDFPGLKTLTVLQTAVALVKRRGIDIDLSADSFGRQADLRCLARAEASKSSNWKVRECAARCSILAGSFRGHHRARCAVSPGPDGQYPDLLRAQARHGETGLHPSQAGADPARHLRSHHLSGAGDAGRADSRRNSHSAKRSPASCHGQENPPRRCKRSASASSPVRLSGASNAIRLTRSSICLSALRKYGFNRAMPRPMDWSAYQTA